MLFWKRPKPAPKKRVRYTRKKITAAARRHYQDHKEKTRQLVLERLEYWNRFYNFDIGQVRIKVTTSRWGSCSSHGNLNFHYQLLFLPLDLADYIIVHELCHLRELNHSRAFWELIEKTMPDYRERVTRLKTYHPLRAHLAADASHPN